MKGGKRNGAGRKPCTDKKQQMTQRIETILNAVAAAAAVLLLFHNLFNN